MGSIDLSIGSTVSMVGMLAITGNGRCLRRRWPER
jgi:hypothetical protein